MSYEVTQSQYARSYVVHSRPTLTAQSPQSYEKQVHVCATFIRLYDMVRQPQNRTVTLGLPFVN